MLNRRTFQKFLGTLGISALLGISNKTKAQQPENIGWGWLHPSHIVPDKYFSMLTYNQNFGKLTLCTSENLCDRDKYQPASITFVWQAKCNLNKARTITADVMVHNQVLFDKLYTQFLEYKNKHVINDPIVTYKDVTFHLDNIIYE